MAEKINRPKSIFISYFLKKKIVQVPQPFVALEDDDHHPVKLIQ
jgi:hypothetical protein